MAEELLESTDDNRYLIKESKKRIKRASWLALISAIMLFGVMIFLYRKDSPLLKGKEAPTKQVGVFIFS